MNPSVSLFLWAHNAQASLEPAVAAALELLGDLGGRFEVVILDPQSADDTYELAWELAQAFPQIRVVRTHLAPEFTAVADLPPAASDVVVMANANEDFCVHALRQQCLRSIANRHTTGHLLRRRLRSRRRTLAIA